MRTRLTALGSILLIGCAADPMVGSTDEAARGGGRGGGDATPTAAPGGGGGSSSLARVAVPRPATTDVVDNAAAVRLGKALFWDAQVGGDGQTACATCHYRAGADTRRLNTIHPGPDGIFQAVPGAGQLWDGSSISSDDRAGSQGVNSSSFVAVSDDPTVAADICDATPTASFGDNRSVTGRNTPSIIASIFNYDNFWDGRANHSFNGANPFGFTANSSGALVAPMTPASLASQSVGPPNNGTEMSCAGRTFNGPGSLGSKMLARPALQLQQVHPGDGVLGALSAFPDNGLLCDGAPCMYGDLIAAAFGSSLAADAEAQFSRIWGQAILAYGATLIPDQTPYDRFADGAKGALTARQQRGLGIFGGKGGCTKCHSGAELSDASVGNVARAGLINDDGGDMGFHNNGVRPTSEDLGRAGLGPNGVSFSVSGAAADRGAFKTPGLRNLKLTAPYFHNGGKGTIAEVVDFYDRGGDFANPEKSRRIKRLGLSSGDKAALVDFLTDGLTDCRVEKERAPFDHPSLDVPNGPALPAIGADGTGSCP